MDRLTPTALRVIALLAVFALTVLFFSSQIDNYLNARLWNRTSTSVAIVALIAVGQAFVVLTRNIDLSIGSIVGVVAYSVGGTVAAFPDMAPILVVTLATLAIFRSLLVQFSGAASITTDSLPGWLSGFAQANAFTVGDLQFRWMVLITLAVVLVAHLYLTRFRSGRQFYAVGSNPDAAKFAGISMARTIFLAFVLSGALAGLAGFMFLSRFGNITVVAGLGFELKSVGAVVVGGVNIFGGSGSVIGVLIGASLIDLIDTSLVRWELVSEFWREAVLGFLILGAVVLDTVLSRRLVRRKVAEAEAAKAPARVEAAE
jgi:rhamnose transport system permease protein